MLKRLTDIIISVAALVILFPVICICIIIIKLESKGPAFFLQKRSGRGGEIFKIFKLRTMVENAASIGPILTQKSDPRITKFGAFLRRTSLDELPQVLNVLSGEMSIVGPRPEVPLISNTYSKELKEVLNYKPGITGISQINGRAALEIEEKIQMEIAYQRKANFLSDLIIILKTPWALISNKGNVM
jgi:lipopolysaccharide/colanic/teichoic acid biosynthesis glycosyltransferase